jgi:hypothetical protein
MDPDQRAVQRELLRVRAALERAQLAQQLEVLSHPVGSGRLAGFARLRASGFRGTSLLRLASALLALVRRQPVLLSAAISIATRFTRSRVLRGALLAAGVAYVAWSISRASSEADEPSGEMSKVDPTGEGGSVD